MLIIREFHCLPRFSCVSLKTDRLVGPGPVQDETIHSLINIILMLNSQPLEPAAHLA
jgi:hypothetical protein